MTGKRRIWMALGITATAIALLAGCIGNSSDGATAPSSSAASKVDPMVGTWVGGGSGWQGPPNAPGIAGPSTLVIAADGTFRYSYGGPKDTQKLSLVTLSGTGTWKVAGSQYTWEISDPTGPYFKRFDLGWGKGMSSGFDKKGTWFFSAPNTLQQRTANPRLNGGGAYLRTAGPCFQTPDACSTPSLVPSTPSPDMPASLSS